MWNARLAKAFAAILVSLCFPTQSGISAEPPKAQTTIAGRVDQVFVQTNLDAIKVGGWSSPDTAVLAQMTIDLESASLLIITFSATGSTHEGENQPTIACMVDTTTPCQPPNQVYFVTRNIWDSRSFTWVVHSATRGKHTVSIGASWLPARPSPPSTFINRTLVIEAAKL